MYPPGYDLLIKLNTLNTLSLFFAISNNKSLIKALLSGPGKSGGQDFSDAVNGVDLADGTRALSVFLKSATPSDFDDIVLSYTAGNLTGVIYKLGAVTLVTLTLTYTGADLTRVQYA